MWFDDRTANAICTACFHPSSRYAFFYMFCVSFDAFPILNVRKLFSLSEFHRIMIAALSFLLDYENIEEEEDDDSDGSSSDDDLATQQPRVLLSKEAVYKVCCLYYDLFM